MKMHDDAAENARSMARSSCHSDLFEFGLVASGIDRLTLLYPFLNIPLFHVSRTAINRYFIQRTHVPSSCIALTTK
jgi:hypothetical protein